MVVVVVVVLVWPGVLSTVQRTALSPGDSALILYWGGLCRAGILLGFYTDITLPKVELIDVTILT